VPSVLPPLKRRQRWISSDSLLLRAVQKANVRGCVSRERAQGRARSRKHHTARGTMQTLRPAKTSRAVATAQGRVLSLRLFFSSAPSVHKQVPKLARASIFFPLPPHEFASRDTHGGEEEDLFVFNDTIHRGTQGACG
jgi:hypothetical protein